MTVIEAIKKYMQEHGYSAICNTEMPCGCFMDNLFICGEIDSSCQLGYEHKCDPQKCGNAKCDWKEWEDKEGLKIRAALDPQDKFKKCAVL